MRKPDVLSTVQLGDGTHCANLRGPDLYGAGPTEAQAALDLADTLRQRATEIDEWARPIANREMLRRAIRGK